MGRALSRIMTGASGALAVSAGAALLLRFGDALADRALRALLARSGPAMAKHFAPQMLDGLPEPAQRFFRFSISPGTLLTTTAVVEMAGQLDLGTKEAPNPQPMTARQIIAPPHGFVWHVRAGSAPMMITGSDALGPKRSWSRFRLMNVVPVARGGGNADHYRSAFGRMVGEGLFWTPAAFLPATEAGWESLAWTAVDLNTAAIVVRTGEHRQSARVSVDKEGRPLRVVFERWSNENADRQYRWQPFGGELSKFRTFGGYRLPTRIVGGNHFGTDLYHPFFHAKVTAIRDRSLAR